MKQKRLAVLNQKGGVGKTTVATNIGRAFQLDGFNVFLGDSDPQGSARDWSGARIDNPLVAVGIDRPNLIEKVKSVTSADLFIIDGAPQVRELAVAAIKVADMVLIPVQPSQYDIWATTDLVELVKSRIELTEGALKAAFVISRAIEGSNLSKDVYSALEEMRLPILNARTTQRVVYADSVAAGLSVFDYKPHNQKAIDEMRALQQEVKAILFSDAK